MRIASVELQSGQSYDTHQMPYMRISKAPRDVPDFVAVVTHTPDATQSPEGHAPDISEPGTSPYPDFGEGTWPSQSSMENN